MRWKQTAKRIAYWTIPPGFRRFIWHQLRRRLASRVVSPVMQAEFARNKKFHNIHRGQCCFILGNGPSINKQDLRPLKDEICFAVSQFFLHKDVREIDPLYHVDAAHHAPFGFDVLRKRFENFNRFYSNQTTYFLGHSPYEYSAFNFLQQNHQFKKDNMHYLNYCFAQQLDELNYSNPDIWDITKNLFAVRSAIYCAIQVAAYMGFKHIYLLGCDHDYLTYITRGKSAHFYSDEEEIDDSSLWISTEEFFLAYHIRWKQYRLMREYLEPRGCYIYNATEGGLLDVFPRVTLAEALAGVHERKGG